MRLLLDENLSPLLGALLRDAGHDTVHVRGLKMLQATDRAVLERARAEGRTLVSADTDFGTLLAETGAAHPSVVLFRRELDRRASAQARLLLGNLDQVEADLDAGAIAVLDATRLRVRRLPVVSWAATTLGLHGPSRWATAVPLVAGRRYRLVLCWFAVGGDGTPQVGLVDVSPPSLTLPGDANALISAVARANPRTVVVASPAQYPGVDGTVRYSEGLDIGYRWYLAHHVTPLFPFGYGLAYTTFRLSDASLALRGGTAVVTVTVTDTGRRKGTDVVEAYLAFPPGSGEPPEQLRAFAPVRLRPGASRRVVLAVPRSGFEAWLGGRWRTVPGTYRLSLGPDVADLVVTLTTPAP